MLISLTIQPFWLHLGLPLEWTDCGLAIALTRTTSKRKIERMWLMKAAVMK